VSIQVKLNSDKTANEVQESNKANESNEANRSEEEQQLKMLEKQINKLEQLLVQSNLRDIAYHYTNKREVVKVNLLAGLSRGIGFTVGTAVFLAILFSILNKIITLPFIGEHIAHLLDMIEQYRSF
jgi:VIT1/CCC1 family predicted Fe2+/Mn2+ transporter